ncbi:MAG: helix-turn-helix transcriptional regulator [Atopobiaceae bacterium]|nr:helix-turn-helix transcriptional regulator [Atopobiaceae bacterium]
MQPSIHQLRDTYAQKIYSVFSIHRQQKIADSQVTFSLAHSLFILPMSGAAEIIVDNEKFVCEKHTIIHAATGHTITYRPLYGQSFEHLNIYYDGIKTKDESNAIFKSYAVEPQGFERILDKSLTLDELNHTPTLDNRIAQIVQGTELIKSMFLLTNSQQMQEKMAEARTYIELHFAEQITIPDLAQKSGMSTQRFSNNFVQTFGVRPMSFIITKRLNHAQQLLQSGLSVRETSKAVGYDDPFYFSRLYKKHMGITPQDVHDNYEGNALIK